MENQLRSCRWILVVLLVTVSTVQAQRVPDSLMVSALAFRTGGFGGCRSDIDTATVQIPFFPAVDFLSAVCTLEHGSPYSAIVGRDSSGVLYLLGDRKGLLFLLDRHPIKEVPPEARIAYALTVLELAGRTYRQSVRLDSAAVLSAAGRAALGDRAKQFYTRSSSQQAGFYVRLATSTLDYDTEVIEEWNVEQVDGKYVYIDTVSTWEGPQISRFDLPRTAGDSALAAAARKLSLDYGALYAASDQRLAAGLEGLFDLTPKLAGADSALHVEVLFEQWVRWKDDPYLIVLKTRSPAVQRAVVARMIPAFDNEPRKEEVSLFVLAKSLGLR